MMQSTFSRIAAFIISVNLILLITACGKDGNSGPAFSFVNQNLQGFIEGTDFNVSFSE